MSEGVIIATPTRGFVATEYVDSRRETEACLAADRIPYGFITAPGNSPIALARDQMASAFLDKCGDAENFFLIDDDLGWPGHKVVEFVRRPEPIVAGVYPFKNEKPNLEYPCALAERDGEPVQQNGLLKAFVVPVGFCRIKRWALQKIADNSPQYREVGHNISYDGVLYEMFRQGPSDGIWVEEGISFIRKALSLGIGVWVDPDIEFTHRGSWIWRGSFRDALG